MELQRTNLFVINLFLSTSDWSVYTGTSGIALMYYKLSALCKDKQKEYTDLAFAYSSQAIAQMERESRWL